MNKELEKVKHGDTPCCMRLPVFREQPQTVVKHRCLVRGRVSVLLSSHHKSRNALAADHANVADGITHGAERVKALQALHANFNDVPITSIPTVDPYPPLVLHTAPGGEGNGLSGKGLSGKGFDRLGER
jgi:hypothetical protein